LGEGILISLWVEDSRIHSQVKGVDVCIDEAVWKIVAGFHIAGIKSHLGMLEPRDFTLFRVGGLEKDEGLCAFVIAWVLLPRGGNQAQLTIEDDEHVPVMEEVEPIGVDKSNYCFKPQSEFEKFVVEQFKKQDVKLNCALKINAFGGTSKDDSDNEEDKIDEDFIEISDSE
ncbi:hypothetical protein V8G54_008064, partial [Vigna mungo]